MMFVCFDLLLNSKPRAMAFEQLNNYTVEIEDFSVEEHALHTEVGTSMLKNMRKISQKNIGYDKHVKTLLNLIYCHRAHLRKTA